VDSHLEKLLSSIIGSDPNEELDDKKREAIMSAVLGMLSAERWEAVWQFAGSISDEFKRSHLLHKLVPRLTTGFQFTLAKQVADSIPLPYWRLSAVTTIASDLLKRDRASSGVNPSFRQEALQLIRGVEENIHLVADEDGDRASIVWEAGLTLVEAGELDWAERIAECRRYCPENAEVLLRVAKAYASRGKNNEARRILSRIADLVSSAEGSLTNRAFDLLHVSELVAELGDKLQARQYLDVALQLALDSDAAHDIDGHKCVAAIAIILAKEGDVDAARDAANRITLPSRREDALQRIRETCLSTRSEVT
jgi:tetratricopeptide (TPR) repeat protein